MERLEVPTALFTELIAKLRARGLTWTTWKIEGKMTVYTGGTNKDVIREEIGNLTNKKAG